MTELSVVIVSYRTRAMLRDCLASLMAESGRTEHEVIVVDNASGDGSAAMVTTEFPAVRLLALDHNAGFAKACNIGVAASSGDYVVLLNPDTVVRDHALDRLLAFGRAHPEAGLCGGRTLRPSGEVDASSCWAQATLWSVFCFATGLSTVFRRSPLFDPESMGPWPRDTVREVGVVTGCLLLAPRPVWDLLGGFDERFWMYGEDADLSIRAWALGYRPMITPDATVTHHVGAASGSAAWKRQLVMAGKVALLDKHWPRRRAVVGKWLLTVGVVLRAAVARIGPRNTSIWPDVWRNRAAWIEGWPRVQPQSAGAATPAPPP